MNTGLFRFSAVINPEMYLKDPESSLLGKNIIRESVQMINELGFEGFTFKKLSQRIGTTEASVYRYFENKNKLLLYLTSWYWAWIEYQLALINANINDPCLKLWNAIAVLSNRKLTDMQGPGDINGLFDIICVESSKSYFVKDVDSLNSQGFFYNYKRIVANIREIILQIDPGYATPNMLISTIIEGIHHQLYFAIHLPSLTDTPPNEDYLEDFYYKLAISSIQNQNISK